MPEGTPRLFPPEVATLGRLAAIVCQAPFASIFVADGGVICWCTGSNVLSAERVPSHDPFLTYLTREPGLLAIADLTNDPRFAQEDCVTGPLTVHAYAGVALRAADGRVKGALAVYDTVERRFVPRETEALLLVAQGAVALLEVEEHKALLETLLANLPLALIACDAQGRVTHYNREAAEMCSMNQREFASDGYSVRAGIYQADGVTPVGRADRPLARTLRGEQVENVELVIIPEGAPERVTVCNGRRLVGLDGRLMGALCVSQDITERRRSELELERVHEQLRASARQAGMAEIATSILHNVGNVLTSINVCAALLGEALRRSKAPDVGRVAALLREQGEKLGQFMTLDERGKIVPGYLQALAEQLLRDNEIALGHLATLRKSLEHVNHAVAMQQNYAKLTSVHETVSVVDLIEDSLRLTAGAFTRHGIELCRQFEPTPPITVDKHKVLQILVNLMRNAQSACDESGRKDKVLTLRLTGAGQGVRISVIDNGVGIAPENMSRLFTHGFTTRTSGHGFGLHSAVIAAQELGGSLHAESAGLGQGASFTLELPRDPPTAGS